MLPIAISSKPFSASLWNWLGDFAKWSLLEKMSVLTLGCVGLSILSGLVSANLLADIFAFAGFVILGAIFFIKGAGKFSRP